MRFADFADWSLRDTVLHRRDSRAKILACLALLVSISRGALVYPALAIFAAILLARLPLTAVLLRASVVLPFSLGFALSSVIAGDPHFALQTTTRSYLSAVCVVVLIGTTSLPSILDALRRLHLPVFLLEVIQFVHRYLFLIAEQAGRMAVAATARGARRSFAAVVGSVGVLFARSYDRAEAIHRSMLARGYNGWLPPTTTTRFTAPDGILVVTACAIAAASFL